MNAHSRPLPSLSWLLPQGDAVADGFRRAWRAVSTRPALAELDDRMLRDIGVTRDEVRAELNRAPWDTDPR